MAANAVPFLPSHSRGKSTNYHQLIAMRYTIALLLSLALLATFTRGSDFQSAQSVLGQPNSTTQTLTQPPTAASMYLVEGTAVDPTTGKLFVADSYNNRILRFSSTAAYTDGASAEVVLGQANSTSNMANRGGSPAANTLNFPINLAIDSAGRLWVTDNGNYRVLRYDNASTKTDGADADGVLGQGTFLTNDPGPRDMGNSNSTEHSKFYDVSGIAVDSSGNLYVSDESFHRVLRFNSAAGKPDGGDADACLGQPDLKTFDIGSQLNQMFSPYGLSCDSSGRLWVADRGSNRILRFDNAAAKTTSASADGLIGQSGPNMVGGGLARNKFSQPYYVTAGPDGTLWVSDYGNTRVLGFLNAANDSGLAYADIVLGQPDYTTNDEQTLGPKSIYAPTQISIGAGNSLFIPVYVISSTSDASRVLNFADPAAGVTPYTPPASNAALKASLTKKIKKLKKQIKAAKKKKQTAKAKKLTKKLKKLVKKLRTL